MAIEQLAEEVVNEVANNLEEAAEVTRSLNVAGLSYFAVGIGVGAAVGFYFGYKFNREKIRAEAYKDAEAEVAQLRKIYLEKTSAFRVQAHTESENDSAGTAVYHVSVPTEKPPIDKVVEDLGYRVEVPPRERPLPAPVPILDDLPENPVETSKSMNAGWNYEQEVRNRSPEAPYIIHQNEFNHSNLNYTKAAFVYYEIDQVMTDLEDDEVIDMDIVGESNLKFGHGSDDINIVYVRNDELETDMQINRVHRSYAEAMADERSVMDSMRDNDDDDDDDDDS